MPPRKSNKTAHVLNLISTSPAEDPAPSVDQTGTDTPLASTVNDTPPQIQIMESLGNIGDPLDTVIRNNLETELESELALIGIPPETVTTDTLPTATAPSVGSFADSPPISTPPTDTIASAPSSDSVVAKEAPTKVMETAEELSYRYINVMEYLVKERVLDSMKGFNMCTCHRCVIDTTALSLTHLQAKYIVVDKDYCSPLLNFYEMKFATPIITELTKACMTVKDFPHHNSI